MGRAKFMKGTEGILNGHKVIFIRQIGSGLWQLEDQSTGELTRKSQTDLLDAYLGGTFKFVEKYSGTPSACKAKGKENAIKQFNRLPDKIQNRAKNRRVYINALLTELGPTPSKALAEAVIKKTWLSIKWPDKPPHPVTVWRWTKRFLPAGNDIRSVVDRYHLSGNHVTRLPEKLHEILLGSIDVVYLTEERKTIQDTLDYSITEVRRENLLRISAQQLPMPKLRQIKRLIEAIPAYDRYAARHGRLAAERHFRSALKKPVTSFPLERAEIDHTRLDLFVVDEETMLPLGRPWLTLCLDVHTRGILGIDLSFDPPSHLTVARCLRHAMLPKGDLQARFPSITGQWEMFGIMETLVCDNGAEFHGDSLEIACLNLGINIQYCPRKQPWFKGSVERTLGTVNRGVAHGVPGTTFSNILEKADYDAAHKATVTLSTLREIIHLWIVDYYHQRPHKSIGDTPAHAWQTEVVGMDIPLPSDPEELKAILGKIDTRELTHKGIEINSLFYNSAEAGLITRRQGTDLTVTVRYQEDDLGSIHILAPDTNTYVEVPAIDQDYAAGLTLWQHRVCRRYAKRHLKGRTDTVALAEAKRRIIELIEDDFGRKRRKTRARSGRFTQNTQSAPSKIPTETPPPAVEDSSNPLQATLAITPRRFTPIIEDRAGT